MGSLLRTKRHTATGKQSQVLVAAENRHMPAWGEWTGLDGTAGPHMLTQGDIGRLLRPFAIRSKTLWPPGRRPGTKSESGYSRQQFEAAWTSYYEPSATPPQASKFRYLSRP